MNTRSTAALWIAIRLSIVCRTITSLIILGLLFGLQSHLFASTATIKLYAYSSDGTNTGTARLGRNVQINASVTGSSGTTVNWSVSGAGSIAGSGLYTAPATMPSNASVTVTAVLASDATAIASYTFTLINPIPVIYGTQPSQLPIVGADTVTIPGTGFVPGTVIQVNGTNVPTTYQSPTAVLAQIAVSATASGTLPLTAVNPAPGGGTGAYQATIATPTITLTAYSSDGTNTNTARLGRNVSISSTVTGSNNTSLSWSVSGAGSVSTSGVYTPPTAMPSNSSVSVTAALTANPSIKATYNITLINPIPTLYGTQPSQLPIAGTDAVTIPGTGYIPGTVIQVNGASVATTYQSPTSVVAQIPVSATASGTLSLTAVNPTPGGGTSAAIQAQIASPTISLSAYNSDGTNTNTARLGLNVSILATLTGAANNSLTWSVSGAGSVSSNGLYTAPASMPSNSSVIITAALVANSSMKATYNMTLINPVPVINQISPWQLATAITNSVTLTGSGFTPSTVVSVNGAPVATTYSSPTVVIAQISVSSTAQGNLTLTAQNPTPGGGTSTSFSAAITPLTIALSEYNENAMGPTSSALGHNMQFLAKIHGSGDPSINWLINWSVTGGGGTISNSGFYQAPLVMPSNPAITVTATLAANTSITTSFQFSLVNPAPVVNATSPVAVPAGATTNVTFSGNGFTPNTIIYADGNAVTTTYLSATAISAPIPVSGSATGPLGITAKNPSPGGGISAPYFLYLTTSTVVSASIGSTTGYVIQPNFVGFSHEWGDAEWFMGNSTDGINYAYRRLVANLTNNGSPFLVRVGGYTTDTSAEPNANTVAPFSELANAQGVHFTLGVNLGANNVQLAVDQATVFINGMPSGNLDALEVGNEPDNYAVNGFRPSTYNITNYINEVTNWNSSILNAEASQGTNVRIMGGAWGSMNYWINNVVAYEQNESQYVNLITQHVYGGYTESGQSFADDYLLTPSVATKGPSTLQPYISPIHGLNQKFRIAEINSIDNGGIAGISDAFASALWSIDTMFEYANAGIDGVNWHGTSGCAYCAFTFAVNNVEGDNIYPLQHVAPLYYGMLFFHQAAGNGAHLLPVTLSSSGGAPPNIKIWSTIDSNNAVRVAIVNKDKTFAGTVAVSLAGRGSAQVTRLVAPSYTATSGVSIGGQTFDGSIDGNLLGSASGETRSASNGIYYIPVQPTSAVLLTIP